MGWVTDVFWECPGCRGTKIRCYFFNGRVNNDYFCKDCKNVFVTNGVLQGKRRFEILEIEKKYEGRL